MINEQLDGQLRMATLDPLEGKQFQVRKRNGNIIDFDETRIYLAIEAALKADAELDQDTPANETMQAAAQRLTQCLDYFVDPPRQVGWLALPARGPAP